MSRSISSEVVGPLALQASGRRTREQQQPMIGNSHSLVRTRSSRDIDRADDHMLAVVGHELGRHRLEGHPRKEVEGSVSMKSSA